MEPSIKNQKIQAMKSYKRAKIVYNLVLYTLTSIITCFFFTSPFWFPSITNYLIFSFPDKVSFWFNAKCFFVVGNLIVIILVGESKLKQSSSSLTSDIYDEYVARSRSSLHRAIHEEKINHHEEKKKEIKIDGVMIPHGDGQDNKRKGMRSCKSEVWGESGILVKMEKSKGKKEDGEKMKMGMRSSKSAVWSESGMVKLKGKKEDGEKMKMGMRSSKSAVWSESGMVKMEKSKGKREDGEKMKMGMMRSSKSAVWSESERVKMERGKGKKEEQVIITSMIVEEEKEVASAALGESEIVERETVEGKKEEKDVITATKSMNEEEKKMGMRSSRSAVWGEREKAKVAGDDEEKKGMRSSKSEIWGEREIVRLGRSVGKEEEEQQLNVLNKRVEDFIARVNKQRSLEAILVDHSRS